MATASSMLAGVIARRKRIDQLKAQLGASLKELREAESSVLEILRQEREIRYGRSVARIGTEETTKDLSLKVLVAKLGEDQAKVVWASREKGTKEVLVIEERPQEES